MMVLLDILIFGTTFPSASSTAASLYTPPKTGVLWEVIRLSPTPKALMQAPWSRRSRMIHSSSEFDATMEQSCSPASSNIALALRVRNARSPESILMAHFLMPMGQRTLLKALIALGIPLFRTS